MTKELLLRFLTSLVLLLVLFYAMVFSGIYLMLLLILFYFLAAYEIIKNTNNILFIFFANILLLLSFYSFYYLRGNSDYSLIILFWSSIPKFEFSVSFFLSDMARIILRPVYSLKACEAFFNPMFS